MSSANSTPMRNDRPHRFPWRPILALVLLLLGATVFIAQSPRAVSRYRQAQRAQWLAPTGVVAAMLEEQLAEGALDRETLDAAFEPLFTREPTDNGPVIAYLRAWANDGTLIYAKTTLPDAGNLDDARVATLRRAAREAYADLAHARDLSDLYALFLAQDNVAALVARAVDTGHASPRANTLWYGLQSQARAYANTLAPRFPALHGAITHMDGVLDDLAHQELSSLRHARDEAEAALDAVMLVSTGLRATVSPAPLAGAWHSAAPPPATLPERLMPGVTGARVSMPLFRPRVETLVLEHAGFVEVVLFDRPVAMMLAVITQCWPAAVLIKLGMLVLVARRPRRRRRGREHDVARDAGMPVA